MTALPDDGAAPVGPRPRAGRRWPGPLVAYLRERFALSWSAPLAAIYGGAALVTGADPLAGGARAWLLILQLRLLDDLADVEDDRTRRPLAITVLRPRALRRGYLALALLNVALGLRHAVALGALIGAYHAWYGTMRARVPGPALRAQLLVVKYAWILWLVAGARSALITGALMLLFYLVFLVHELGHDPRLYHHDELRRAACVLAALAVVVVWSLSAHLRDGRTACLAALASACLFAVACAGMWRRDAAARQARRARTSFGALVVQLLALGAD